MVELMTEITVILSFERLWKIESVRTLDKMPCSIQLGHVTF